METLSDRCPQPLPLADASWRFGLRVFALVPSATLIYQGTTYGVRAERTFLDRPNGPLGHPLEAGVMSALLTKRCGPATMRE